MVKCRAVFAIVLAVLFFPAIAWANPKPSFDCAKASSFAEKAVCSNDDLAQLDVRMSKAYKAQLAATSNITSAKAAQRTWVKKREACGSVECIRTLYAARIPELGGGIVVAAAKSTSGQSETYVVANTQPPDDYLSLRSDPSVSVGKRIAKMPNGTELRLLQGNLEGWARVEIVATGQKGWAFAGTDTTKYIVLRPTTTTAESTTSSASEPAGFFVVSNITATNGFIWLRSNASVSTGKQIAKLASGTAMEVLDRSKGAWLRVKVVETGKEGWVFSGSDSTKYVIWKTKAAIAAEAAEEKAKQAAIEKAAAEAKAAKLAADQARVAAAEAAKKAPIIAEISAALGNPDPADLLLFVNEGGDVPNLAKNLDGQLVSATGKLSVCHTEIASPYAGARGQRYGKLVADFLNTALPSGAEPSSVDLEHCGSQTPVDVVYFQLGQLEAAPLKFVQYLNEKVNVSLAAASAFTLVDAENAEAAIVAAQQKAIADKAALKTTTLENIRSGTADGFGFVVVTGTHAPLCYFDGGEISAVMADNTELVLQQIFTDATISEDISKLNTNLTSLNSLDEIYIGMTRKPPSCGWMFGDRTSLQKVAAAMDRDGIAFDTLPYWTTAEDIVPLIDAAKIEQQTMAEAKAAQEAEAALAAEKQAAEQKVAEDEAAAEAKKLEAEASVEDADADADNQTSILPRMNLEFKEKILSYLDNVALQNPSGNTVDLIKFHTSVSQSYAFLDDYDAAASKRDLLLSLAGAAQQLDYEEKISALQQIAVSAAAFGDISMSNSILNEMLGEYSAVALSDIAEFAAMKGNVSLAKSATLQARAKMGDVQSFNGALSRLVLVAASLYLNDFEQARSLSRELDAEQIFKFGQFTKQQIVMAYLFEERFDDAIELANEITDPDRQATAFLLIAKRFRSSGDITKSEQFVSKAVSLSELSTSVEDKIEILSDVAFYEYKCGDAENGLLQLSKAENADRNAIGANKSYYVGRLGAALVAAGRSDDAKQLIAGFSNDWYNGKATFLVTLAEAATMMQKESDAKVFSAEAFEIIPNSYSIPAMVDELVREIVDGTAMAGRTDDAIAAAKLKSSPHQRAYSVQGILRNGTEKLMCNSIMQCMKFL